MMPNNLTPDQKEQLKMARRSGMRIEETWSLYIMFLSEDKRPADALQLAVEAVSVWADWMDANQIDPPEIEPNFPKPPYILGPFPAPNPRPTWPALEDLDRAAKEVEQSERGLEALDNMIEDLPETSAAFIREVQRPMIVGQLESAKARLTMIQTALENNAAAQPEATPEGSSTTQPKGEK